MDYESTMARFPPPPPGSVPRVFPVEHAGLARRLRDAAEPIGAHAFWARPVHERCADLGLDFLSTYLRGRVAPLGDPPMTLVLATFGVFSPSFVTRVYGTSGEKPSPEELLQIREAGTVASLVEILGEPDEVKDVVSVLRHALGAADVTGRSLFAALSAQPWPEHPVGQLWRACELVREHRGDGHLAVCVAAGFDPIEMNVLTELHCGMALGRYTASRGWTNEEIEGAARRLEGQGLVANGLLTERGRAVRTDLEEQTDGTQAALIEAIGDDLDTIVERLAHWSQRIIDAQGFPADPFKRAAG